MENRENACQLPNPKLDEWIMYRKLGTEYYLKQMLAARNPIDYWAAAAGAVVFAHRNMLRELSHAFTFAI